MILHCLKNFTKLQNFHGINVTSDKDFILCVLTETLSTLDVLFQMLKNYQYFSFHLLNVNSVV